MELTVERLEQALAPRSVHFFKQTGSTNDHATAWLTDGTPAAGSVVVADEQTRGRGRLGRAWYAPPGTALMVSYILRPPADQIAYVGMMGALVVCELVEALNEKPGAQPGIKWPNDVQIDGRKLCGVLPEACWQGAQLLGVAIGIGMNVRVDFADTEYAETAVNLEDVVGITDRVELLCRLVARLDYWSAHLASDDLFEAWRDRLVMLGRRVSIGSVGGRVEGIAEAVDRQGALMIRDADGALRRMIAGDIALG